MIVIVAAIERIQCVVKDVTVDAFDEDRQKQWLVEP